MAYLKIKNTQGIKGKHTSNTHTHIHTHENSVQTNSSCLPVRINNSPNLTVCFQGLMRPVIRVTGKNHLFRDAEGQSPPHLVLQGDNKTARDLFLTPLSGREREAALPVYCLFFIFRRSRKCEMAGSLSLLAVDRSQKRDPLLILLISSFHICMLIF